MRKKFFFPSIHVYLNSNFSIYCSILVFFLNRGLLKFKQSFSLDEKKKKEEIIKIKFPGNINNDANECDLSDKIIFKFFIHIWFCNSLFLLFYCYSIIFFNPTYLTKVIPFEISKNKFIFLGWFRTWRNYSWNKMGQH